LAFIASVFPSQLETGTVFLFVFITQLARMVIQFDIASLFIEQFSYGFQRFVVT